MTYRILTAASLVALLAGCSHEAPRMSPSEAAYSAYLAGDYAAAEQGYGAILASDPNNATALLGMGELMEAAGRTNEAVEYYQRAYAAQSGSIRVWDAGVMQDGVTEVAFRRLGGLSGHGVAYAAPVQAYEPQFEEPPYVAPAIPTEPVYSAPVTPAPSYAEPTHYEPVYTQPIEPAPSYVEPAYAEPAYVEPSYAEPAYVEPAYVEPTYTAPAYVEPAYAPPAYVEPTPVQPAYSAPAYQQPAQIAPAYTPPPAAPQPRYALDDEGYVYYSDPEATQPISEDVFDSLDSAVDEAVAPQYARPTPKPLRSAGSNGYTIVDGVVEQVGAPQHTPMPVPARETVTYETMPVNIGTPTDVIRSGVPLQTPQQFGAPRGVDMQDSAPLIYLDN